jgi:Co/Zn/Cd efflux system component
MTLIDTSKLFWDRVWKPLGAMINSDRREIHSMKALSVRVAALAFIGLAAASIAILAGADRQLVDVIVLGVALVAADLAELRPANRLALPLGFALVLVLLRAASATEFVVAVTAGSAAAVVLRTDKATAATRLLVFAEFLAAGLGAGVVFQLAMDAARRADPRAAVLGSLACAAFVEILVADLVSLARDHRLAPVRSRAADLALVSSGMLMAVG